MRSSTRRDDIDLLKSLSIIFVILAHNLPTEVFKGIGGPFYVGQQVPIFMILAGYNGIQSYSRRGITTLVESYSWENMSRRLMPLIIPFIPIWVLEVFLSNAVLHTRHNLWGLAGSFVSGGWGPGSYFIPVMIQQVLLLPLLLWLARRQRWAMLVLAFGLDMAFELFGKHWGLPASIYRLVYLRYLFAGALGAWIASGGVPRRIWMWPGVVISVVYISAVEYFGFHLPIEPSWGSQNAPSFLWSLALVLLGFELAPRKAEQWPWRLLARVGRGSYHIFLFQMVYFWAKWYGIRYEPIVHLPLVLLVPLEVVLCISGGLALRWAGARVGARVGGLWRTPARMA